MLQPRTLILASAVMLAFAACRHADSPAAAEPTAATPLDEGQSLGPSISFGGFTDTIALEVKRKPRQDKPSTKPASQAKTASQKPDRTAPKAAAKAKGKPERIYVETEGAQGRVWGHVTLQGDRGTGTIHDWDENTLSVTVTRHGNELYAIDQNSRQYVFRLK